MVKGADRLHKLVIVLLVIAVIIAPSVLAGLDDGLIRYYNFDNDSTTGSTLIDQIGIQNGTITTAVTGQEGKIGESYKFDGNDYVTIGGNYNVLSDGTICTWANTSDTSGWLMSATGITDNMEFFYNNGIPDEYIFEINNGGAQDARATDVVNDGSWAFLCFSWGSDGMKVYVNSVLNATDTFTGWTGSTGNFYIGDLQRGLGNGWIGNIDELGIWNRSLTQTEITRLYANGGGTPYPFTIFSNPTVSNPTPVVGENVEFNITIEDADRIAEYKLSYSTSGPDDNIVDCTDSNVVSVLYFNESSGSLTDCGDGNTWTSTGSPGYSATGINSIDKAIRMDTAVEFNSGDTYGSYMNSDFSFILIVKQDGTPEQVNYNSFFSNNEDSASDGIYLRYDPLQGESDLWGGGTQSGYIVQATAPSIADNDWHFIAVTYSETNQNASVYVDNVLAGNDDSFNINTATNSMKMNQLAYNSGFNGNNTFSEWVMFDKELTQAEMTVYYEKYFKQKNMGTDNYSNHTVDLANEVLYQDCGDVADIGLDGVEVSNSESMASHGWNINTGAPVYSNLQKYLGNFGFGATTNYEATANITANNFYGNITIAKYVTNTDHYIETDVMYNVDYDETLWSNARLIRVQAANDAVNWTCSYRNASGNFATTTGDPSWAVEYGGWHVFNYDFTRENEIRLYYDGEHKCTWTDGIIDFWDEIRNVTAFRILGGDASSTDYFDGFKVEQGAVPGPITPSLTKEMPGDIQPFQYSWYATDGLGIETESDFYSLYIDTLATFSNEGTSQAIANPGDEVEFYINITDLNGIVNYTFSYYGDRDSQTATDYYYNGTYYIQDGLDTSDTALDGSTPSASDSLSTTGYVSDDTQFSYENTKSLFGDLGMYADSSGGQHSSYITGIQNSTFDGRIGVWMYTSTDSSGTEQAGLFPVEPTTASKRMGLGVRNSVSIYWNYYDQPTVAACDENTISQFSGWHHLEFVFNYSASEVKGYIDDVLCHTWTGRTGLEEFALFSGSIVAAGDSEYWFDGLYVSDTHEKPTELAWQNETTALLNETVYNASVTQTMPNQEFFNWTWYATDTLGVTTQSSEYSLTMNLPTEFSNPTVNDSLPDQGVEIEINITTSDNNGLVSYTYSWYNQTFWVNETTLLGPSSLKHYYALNNNLDDEVGTEFTETTSGTIIYETEFPSYNTSGNGSTHSINGDGVSSYLKLNGSMLELFENNDNFSVSFWGKFDSFDGTQDRLFRIYYNNNDDADYGYITVLSGGTSVQVDIRYPNLGGHCGEGTGYPYSFSADTWYHFVYRYDTSNNGNVSVWIDGAYVGGDQSGNCPSVNKSALSGLTFLGHGHATLDMEGNVDEIRMFDGALSESEILEIYNTGATQAATYPTSITASTIQTAPDFTPYYYTWYAEDIFGTITQSDVYNLTVNQFMTFTNEQHDTGAPFAGTDTSLNITITDGNLIANYTFSYHNITEWINITRINGTSSVINASEIITIPFGIDFLNYTWYGTDLLGYTTQSQEYVMNVTRDFTPPGFANPSRSHVEALYNYNVTFNMTFTDDFGLNNTVFSYNLGAGWVNDTPISIDGLSATVQVYKIMPTAGSTWNYTWYATDDYDNINQSEIFVLNISRNPTHVETLTIYPQSPGTNSYLSCAFDSWHDRINNISADLKWYKNSVEQTQYAQSYSFTNISIITGLGSGTINETLVQGDVWNCSLELTSIDYNNSNSTSVTVGGFIDSGLNFDPFTNSSKNNTAITIDVSCPSAPRNVYLWFDDVNPPVNLVLDNSTNTSYDTSLFGLDNGTFYFRAGCVNDTIGTIDYLSHIQYWTFDNFFPQISVNTNNFFTQSSESTINQYGDTALINLSFVENTDLFAFQINITKDSTEIFSYTNETLSGLTYNYSQLLDISSWEVGVYDIEVQISDSHTKNQICPFDDQNCYKPKKKSSELEFDTPEGVNLRIVTKDTSTVDTTKLDDRYTFEFDFADGKEKLRKIDIFSDKKLVYKGDVTQIPGHFVVMADDGVGGNWIDFEGEGILFDDVTVKKITDYNYELTFKKLKKNQKFESIGGLNVNIATYVWYRGNLSLTNASALERLPAALLLNVTFNSTLQSDINAVFTHQANVSSTQTKTVYDSYITFLESFTAETVVEGEINISDFSWNITISQPTEPDYSFINSSQMATYGWDMDDCSTYNTTLMNYTLFDESTGAVLPGGFNASFVHDFWVDGYPSVEKAFDINLLNSQQVYTMCKFPDFVNFTGDTNHLFSAVGYETRDFRLFNIPFEGLYTAYILETSFTNAYITYILQDSSLNKIEGAVMSFFRDIGGISTLVHRASTDFAGSVTVYQDQQVTYDIQINASGFDAKEITLRPINVLYTIQLEGDQIDAYPNAYSGIRYRLNPTTYYWNLSGDWQRFDFEIEGEDLEYAGIAFDRYGADFVCLPANCMNETTSATGGKMTIYFNASEAQNFLVQVYFKRVGHELIYINDDMGRIGVFQELLGRLYDIMGDVEGQTSPVVTILIVAIAAIAVVAFFASFGIVGIVVTPAVLLVMWIFAIAGCRQGQNIMNGCDFYFIHPTWVILISTVLMATYMWIWSRRND